MKKEEIQKTANHIIDLMQQESLEAPEHQSSFRNAVWLMSSERKFLYNDLGVPDEVIISLLAECRIVFKGYEKHQGEMMFKWVLPNN